MLGWKIARIGLCCNDSEEDRLFSELHLSMGNQFGARSAKREVGGSLCIEMGFTLMFLANLLTHGLLNLTKYNLKICYRMTSNFASGVAFCVKGNVRINLILTHSKGRGGAFWFSLDNKCVSHDTLLSKVVFSVSVGYHSVQGYSALCNR